MIFGFANKKINSVKYIFLINFYKVVMQPAHHAANNFPFSSRGLHKIKAFSSNNEI